MNVRWLAIVGIFPIAPATVSAQQNWPQFRGPNAGVISDSSIIIRTASNLLRIAKPR